MEDVADAAAVLFTEGGYDAVSIEAVAERLTVSRATLYRTVPSKEHLLGIVLDWYTSDLTARVEDHLAVVSNPAEALQGLIRIQVDAAIRTKDYFAVLVGGAGVQSDAYRRWQRWSRRHETMWRKTVERAIDAGVLAESDPEVTTRLVLGMVLWVSRWYRESEGYTAAEIAETAVKLIVHNPVRWPPSMVAANGRRAAISGEDDTGPDGRGLHVPITQ
ncbi:TetR/AcrR family transcriptional regulator [Rhodococcus rhodochrous]|uniref:TetR/AcrR family transcriptional regulator n=1 Tax=Rhodococcus rhodochrous TaxID=1829 RepID=UPI001E510364|nr:TetR/AcrR family transcriptional regulator [Rhodococcus rhodochrous]